MSFVHSPKIITEGLVLSLDAGNVKSYPGSGTVWTDKSGYGYNGALTNGPTFNSSNGGSIVFDGTNDFINVSTGFTFANGTANKTMEVWFRPTGIDSSSIVQAGEQNTSGKDFEIVYTVEGDTGGSTNIPAQYKAMGGIYGALWANDIFIPMSYTNMVKDKWHQAVLTLSGGTNASLFYNGELPMALKWANSSWSQTLESQPFTFTGINTGANQPLYLGRAQSATPWGSGQLYFPGNISIFRFYNRTLSAQEVLQNYNATKSRFNIT
jgi:hypothetical protein